MPQLELGNAKYELIPAEGRPEFRKVLTTHSKLFRSYAMVVYFWDCDTQTGVPRQRPRGVNATPAGHFYVFDTDTARPLQGPSRANKTLHTDRIGLSKKALVDALRAKLPVVAAGIPYATHVDPFTKDHYVKVTARISWMTFIAKRVGAPAGEHGIWITYPHKITFTSKLIGRCDGKPVVLPDGWKGSIDVPFDLNPLAKKMKEAHDKAVRDAEEDGD